MNMARRGQELELVQEEEEIHLRDTLPVMTEPRCNICKSSVRTEVDKLIVMGHGPSSIAKQIKGQDEHLNGSLETLRKSVERHGKKHLNIEEEAIRRTIEARARERGILVDYAEEKLVTTKAVLDLVVAKGIEQVTEPGARVKYQDILKAVELLEEYESNSFAAELEQLQRQMWAIREAVRRVCPPELFEELARVVKELYEGTDPFAVVEVIDVKPKELESNATPI